VYLPAVADEEAVPASPPEASIFPKKRLTILIIDDENIVIRSVSRILRANGYTVDSAPDGMEGIERFSATPQRWDLVILDLSMPMISGDMVLSRILEINRNAKVLMSTGYRSDPRIAQCLKMGALGVLEKPFTAEKLAQELTRIIAG
jgi:CheY-like chemotaxis protein